MFPSWCPGCGTLHVTQHPHPILVLLFQLYFMWAARRRWSTKKKGPLWVSECPRVFLLLTSSCDYEMHFYILVPGAVVLEMFSTVHVLTVIMENVLSARGHDTLFGRAAHVRHVGGSSFDGGSMLQCRRATGVNRCLTCADGPRRSWWRRSGCFQTSVTSATCGLKQVKCEIWWPSDTA